MVDILGKKRLDVTYLVPEKSSVMSKNTFSLSQSSFAKFQSSLVGQQSNSFSRVLSFSKIGMYCNAMSNIIYVEFHLVLQSRFNLLVYAMFRVLAIFSNFSCLLGVADQYATLSWTLPIPFSVTFIPSFTIRFRTCAQQ